MIPPIDWLLYLPCIQFGPCKNLDACVEILACETRTHGKKRRKIITDKRKKARASKDVWTNQDAASTHAVRPCGVFKTALRQYWNLYNIMCIRILVWRTEQFFSMNRFTYAHTHPVKSSHQRNYYQAIQESGCLRTKNVSTRCSNLFLCKTWTDCRQIELHENLNINIQKSGVNLFALAAYFQIT
jgi:hypothetical protein